MDKTGLPYVFHPFHLTEQMTDEISTVCALLHDVVEDPDLDFTDIKRSGFTPEVIDVLQLLTHDPAVPYLDYVRALKSNDTAKRVKLADLAHNSDLSRLDVIDKQALARNEKYRQAMA